MPAQWTGELVGKMHNAGVTAKQLAAEMGKNPKYVSQVLNAVRFGKVFCKTCAVMLALLGLAALASLPTAPVSAVLTLIGAIAALNWVCGAWFTLCEMEVALQ